MIRIVLIFSFYLFDSSIVNGSENKVLLEQAMATPGRAEIEFAIGDKGGKYPATTIPITVIRGKDSGPTLLVLAGIHGSEYSPIIATQRLAPQLNYNAISGNVIFVHIANLPAYLGRTVYTSPADDKNLNRLFPGDAAGSLSNKIAHTLTTELYSIADAVLDMHSGDGNEQLIPSWTGYYGKAGSDEVIEASRKMAHAFGIQHIVEFQWEFEKREQAIWAGSAAIAMNIPSIDVEAGGMGIIDEPAINQIITGVRRTMAHLGMTQEEFAPLPFPTIIRERSSVKAPQDGSWTALVDAGEQVSKGQLIGFLTYWHGRKIFEARAKIDGLLLLGLEAPPALKGETLFTIAKEESN